MIMASKWDDVASDLRSAGYTIANSAVGASTCAALRARVLDHHDRARDAMSRGELDEVYAFGRIAAPMDRRIDLRLPLALSVRAALHQAAAHVGPIIDAFLDGGDGELVELSSLISLPASSAQPIHADTTDAEPSIVTVFIALQDISLDMGPTLVWPRTHSRDACRIDPASAPWPCAAARARGRAPTPGTLRAGGALVMDSRLAHCGAANASDVARVLLYFSVRRVDGCGTGSTRSLLREYVAPALRWSERRAWLSATSVPPATELDAVLGSFDAAPAPRPPLLDQALHAAPFLMRSWCSVFANAKAQRRHAAMEWLWAHFNESACALYRVRCRDAISTACSALPATVLAHNRLLAFQQRCDAMRGSAFGALTARRARHDGAVCGAGDEASLVLEGYWLLLRGDAVEKLKRARPARGLAEWQELPSGAARDATVRQAVAACWCADGSRRGERWLARVLCY